MNGEHHVGSEHDWRDGPGDGSKTLDDLSQEEIRRALASLDERLKVSGEDTYSLLARSCCTASWERTAWRWKTSRTTSAGP